MSSHSNKFSLLLRRNPIPRTGSRRSRSAMSRKFGLTPTPSASAVGPPLAGSKPTNFRHCPSYKKSPRSVSPHGDDTSDGIVAMTYKSPLGSTLIGGTSSAISTTRRGSLIGNRWSREGIAPLSTTPRCDYLAQESAHQAHSPSAHHSPRR